jgi:hypothetical protein
MQPRPRLLTAFTLGTVMYFGAAAMAADLPKEGTFSGTYSAFSTNKATPIGKEGLVDAWDSNGLSLGNGFLDHATWHCFGLYDVMNNKAQWHGYCVATDPAGDQILTNVATDGSYPADAKSYSASGKIMMGTGKYAGITGATTYVGHSPDFRTAVAGTIVENGPLQGSYKLP